MINATYTMEGVLASTISLLYCYIEVMIFLDYSFYVYAMVFSFNSTTYTESD